VVEPPPPKPKPRPEPPKQVAKVEPKEPPKKQPEKFDLNEVLKNLSKNAAPQPEKVEPKPAKPSAPQQQASNQPVNAPLGPQLTTSEIDLIRQQIQEHWNAPVGAKSQDAIVSIQVTTRPDGTVSDVRIVDSGDMSDPVYRATAESLRRAALYFRETPLKVPLDKYERWKSILLRFNTKELS
jgi:hypothetical protein